MNDTAPQSFAKVSSVIKILAIDDKNDNLISVNALLKDIFPDFVVFTALDGPKGIELAIAEDPDVILLDVVMPEMDGFQVCRHLKKDVFLREIPVVFLTALKETRENRLLALEVGAEAFLSKPIDIIELAAQINAMIKIKAANIAKRDEQKRLEEIVTERTSELERTQIAMLNLMEDLKAENESRRKTECALNETLNYLQSILLTTRDGFSIVDIQGKFTNVNNAYCEMTGYTREEILKLTVMDIAIDEIPEQVEERFQQIIKKGSEIFQTRHRKKDGSVFDVELSVSFLDVDQGEFVSFCRDITERMQSEVKIQKSLKEKEVLLKEIHHRVKNNMQIIISILNLQSKKVQDKYIVNILEDCRSRVYSMALVHEQLYKSNDFSKIDMETYVESIMHDLRNAYSPGNNVKCELNVSQVYFDINHSIPCGLILNELISNVYKHAFSDKNEKIIKISLTNVGNNFYELIVQDNGKGLPEGFDIYKVESMGSLLITTLTQQLHGTLEIINNMGATFKISFKIEDKSEQKGK